MARPVTTLAIFFVTLNAFAGMLVGTGAAADMGLDTRVGGDDSVQDANEEAQQFESGSPSGETLFGMYNVLSDSLGTIFGVIFPGLRMLYNAGAPAFLVGGPSTIGFLPPIFSLMLGITVISFLRGWDL